MPSNPDDWMNLAAGVQDDLPAPNPANTPANHLEPADDMRPSPDTSVRAAAVALHPRLRLALDELLDAESAQSHNLAILVGRVRQIPARRGRASETRSRTTPGAVRFQITDYGIREDLFRLEIQEVAGDGLDSGVTSYSMELAISHRLLESGLFVDGQRLAICGPLSMERSYDARFARSATDPGRPDWTTKLHVLTMLPVDDTIPDGSFVELVGTVEGEPRIRREPVSAGAFEPFATVRLRCRRQLRSGIGRSRAVFTTSTLLPLEVALSGELANAGALLRAGNTVHVHGRLIQYRYQLPVRPPAGEAGRADRKSVPDVLDDIATSARVRLAQRRPDADPQLIEREVRRAQQRFLTVVKPTIEVGYVELQGGVPLDEAEIAALVTNWRPRRSRDRLSPDLVQPTPDAVAAALDTATAQAFSADDTVAPPAQLEAERPRRRARPAMAATSGEMDSGAGQDTDSAHAA